MCQFLDHIYNLSPHSLLLGSPFTLSAAPSQGLVFLWCVTGIHLCRRGYSSRTCRHEGTLKFRIEKESSLLISSVLKGGLFFFREEEQHQIVLT